jgi:anti-sigma B factor antagonist
MSDLRTRVTKQSQQTAITVDGEIDVATARDFLDTVIAALRPGVTAISLDGRQITFLSAAGISALVEVVKACQKRGVQLELDLSPRARKVLDVVGLWWLGVIDDGIEIETALQEALRDYADSRTIELREIEEAKGDDLDLR